MQQPDLFESSERPAVSVQESMLAIAERWYQRGWIRALDLALVRLLDQLQPGQPRAVLMAALFTSHQLSRGHLCLDLEAMFQSPDWQLALPPDEQKSADFTDLPSSLMAGDTLQTWLAQLSASPLVDVEGSESSAPAALKGAPLILSERRLYLRRQWRYEVEVAEMLSARAATPLPDWPELRQDLNDLFDTDLEPDWQKLACTLASRRQLTIITGGPGTGKTTTVVKLLALLQHHQLRHGPGLEIVLAAPTGKAAARLSESIGGAIEKLPPAYRNEISSEVRTLHKILGVTPGKQTYRYNAGNRLSADLVVVDESSMVDLGLFHALLCALRPQARLVLLGDKDQLASVEAGAVLGELCRNAESAGYSDQTLDWLAAQGSDIRDWIAAQGVKSEQPIAQCTVMLRKSYRFDARSGIGRLALAVNQMDAAAVQRVLNGTFERIGQIGFSEQAQGDFRRLICSGQADQPGYRPYLELLRTHQASEAELDHPACIEWGKGLLASFDRFRILTPVRRGERGVEGLNPYCETILAKAGLLTPREGWYEGRPVMLTRNDYSLGLMNGDTGICLSVVTQTGQPQLRVLFKLANGTLKWVAPSRLEQVETAFAMTVHKSQGSEFEHSALMMPQRSSPVLTKELIYTAITRAKQHFTLVQSDAGVLEQAVLTPISRASGLYSRFQS